MDILEIIRRNIAVLPTGVYQTGLLSVLRHIDAAHRHLARGQETKDDSLFTDAIYRTNQAFEGSVKEAYRVLTNEDPQHLSPYKIEKYLQEKGVFKDRVLAQFTLYRKDWRNPSSHDYNLDFDEDEAFLAIMSVSAFTKLLVDQILERVSFVEVEQDLQYVDSTFKNAFSSSQSLYEMLIISIMSFVNSYIILKKEISIETKLQLLGSLTAYLEMSLPDARFHIDYLLDNQLRTDVLIEDDEQTVILEIKLSVNPRDLFSGLYNLNSRIKLVSDTNQAPRPVRGILLLFAHREGDYMHYRQNVEECEIEVISELPF